MIALAHEVEHGAWVQGTALPDIDQEHVPCNRAIGMVVGLADAGQAPYPIGALGIDRYLGLGTKDMGAPGHEYHAPQVALLRGLSSWHYARVKSEPTAMRECDHQVDTPYKA